MRIAVVVTVEVNEQELAKHNRKCVQAGRAQTTAFDVVEDTICNALKHNWMTPEHTLVPVESVSGAMFGVPNKRLGLTLDTLPIE